MTTKPVLLIHGGAGLSSPKNLPQERQEEAISVLKKIIKDCYEMLQNNSPALDVVEAAVNMLEDCPLFNAGYGSVIASDGKCYADASIMDGKTGLAGALCGSTQIKNPISVARKIMERTPHVMLIGEDVHQFAVSEGFELIQNEELLTEYRISQLQRAQKSNKLLLDHESVEEGKSLQPEEKMGTVGAVALDAFGDLAAATSTGGLVNKRVGRVGDSAIIGSGTFVNNQTCAVSSTGHGEVFMRHCVAVRISHLMEFGGLSLQKAAQQVLEELPEKSGGLIAVDRDGNFCLPFTSGGMFRGFCNGGEPVGLIWK